MNTNEQIAIWLGYRRHSVFQNNWYLPGAEGDTPGNCTIPTPDFASDPAHYERIKRKVRGLNLLYYELTYHQKQRGERFKLSLCFFGVTSPALFWTGSSEGDVLVKCALALMENDKTKLHERICTERKE